MSRRHHNMNLFNLFNQPNALNTASDIKFDKWPYIEMFAT